MSDDSTKFVNAVLRKEPKCTPEKLWGQYREDVQKRMTEVYYEVRDKINSGKRPLVYYFYHKHVYPAHFMIADIMQLMGLKYTLMNNTDMFKYRYKRPDLLGDEPCVDYRIVPTTDINVTIRRIQKFVKKYNDRIIFLYSNMNPYKQFCIEKDSKFGRDFDSKVIVYDMNTL